MLRAGFCVGLDICKTWFWSSLQVSIIESQSRLRAALANQNKGAIAIAIHIEPCTTQSVLKIGGKEANFSAPNFLKGDV